MLKSLIGLILSIARIVFRLLVHYLKTKMEHKENRFIKNIRQIIGIMVQIITLTIFFVKMDDRISALEKWRDEVNPQRVTMKDLYLIEEKMKHMDSKISDIKESVKEINQKLK